MGWERHLGVHNGGDVLSVRGTGLGIRDGHCPVVLDKSLKCGSQCHHLSNDRSNNNNNNKSNNLNIVLMTVITLFVMIINLVIIKIPCQTLSE